MVMPGDRVTVTFRNAQLIFKNFAGEEKKFNAEGNRNFSILLDGAQARELEKDGWNVKPLPIRDGDEEQKYHLKVAVSFKNRPPRVWLISSSGRTMLVESVIGMLDQLDAIRVDLTISAYDWSLSTGASGRKAYLQSMFYHMYEDELELEYGDVPVIPSVGDIAPKYPDGVDSEVS